MLLNKNWRYFGKKNHIYFFNLVTSKQLEITDDVDESLFVLDNLKKGITKKEMVSVFKNKFPILGEEWLEISIKTLESWGIISKNRIRSKSLTDVYLNGLDRQLDFLEEVFPIEGKYSKQLQLKKAKVAILGLGVTAQYIILALEACGVGNFKCIDFDLVEKRNIGRQPLLRMTDIGKYKTDVVKKYLKESRSGVSVVAQKIMIKSAEDVRKIIKDSDIVLHCCDYPRFLIHRWINEACLDLKKPNLLIYSGRVGPFSFPYETSCYGCMESFLKKHVKAYEKLTKEITSEGMGRYPELAVVGSVTGSLAAKEVISYILGMEIETKNNFFDIDPSNIKIIKHSLPRLKDCYACGRKKK